MTKKIKRQLMTLEVTLGGKDFTFKTPQAEDILAQIKAIEKRSAGTDLVHLNNLEGYTFCCGDHYTISFNTDEVTLKETEVDCYGYPVTYIGDEAGATTTISNGVVKVTKA